MYLVLPREPYVDADAVCDRCGEPGGVVFDDGSQRHVACDDEIRREAAEEALAEAEPMTQHLAAAVRSRGNRFVFMPRAQLAAAQLPGRDEGAEA